MGRKPSGQRPKRRHVPGPPAAVHVERLDDAHLVVTSPSPLTDADRNAIIALLGRRGHPTLTRSVWVEPAQSEVDA